MKANLKIDFNLTSLFALCCLLICSGSTLAAGPDYKITMITPTVIVTPDFSNSYSGYAMREPNPLGKWLQIEVQFKSYVDFTDELTFKYYVLFAGKLLTGQVTHISILKGYKLHSVMYVAPHTLIMLMDGRPVTPAALQNVTVLITRQGKIIDEMSLRPAKELWWQAFPRLTGLLLNKDETPFAPLYWDRYETIKASTRP